MQIKHTTLLLLWQRNVLNTYIELNLEYHYLHHKGSFKKIIFDRQLIRSAQQELFSWNRIWFKQYF